MSSSRDLAVIGRPKAKAESVKAEKMEKTEEKVIPPVEDLYVHSALLLAAESVASKDAEGPRPWLAGVFLHRRDKVCRVVGADGHRMFIGSFPIEGKSPTWLTHGVILSADGLRKRVQMIMGMQESPMIKLSHTTGHGHVEMTDFSGDATFRISRLPIAYFDYDRLIGPEAFAMMDEDGNIRGREWEPVGINSTYLKSCGDIAKTLEAGLPKERRTKTGMVVRAYTGGSVNAPLLFDFDTWPGAILAIYQTRMADSTISKETAAIIAPATKLTLAALRAHATRQLAWAEAADDEGKKAEHQAKADGFLRRIGQILNANAALPAIARDYEQSATIRMPEHEPQVDTSDWLTPRGDREAEPVEAEPEAEPQTFSQETMAQGEVQTDPEPQPEPEPEVEPEPEPEPEPKAEAEPTIEAEPQPEPVAEEKPTVRRTKIKIDRSKKKAA